MFVSNTGKQVHQFGVNPGHSMPLLWVLPLPQARTRISRPHRTAHPASVPGLQDCRPMSVTHHPLHPINIYHLRWKLYLQLKPLIHTSFARSNGINTTVVFPAVQVHWKTTHCKVKITVFVERLRASNCVQNLCFQIRLHSQGLSDNLLVFVSRA